MAIYSRNEIVDYILRETRHGRAAEIPVQDLVYSLAEAKSAERDGTFVQRARDEAQLLAKSLGLALTERERPLRFEFLDEHGPTRRRDARRHFLDSVIAYHNASGANGSAAKTLPTCL